MKYFSLEPEDIVRKTGASQQSVSDWLLKKSCPRKSTLMMIAANVPEPVPLWWLTAGPEALPLSQVLAKEKGVVVNKDVRVVGYYPAGGAFAYEEPANIPIVTEGGTEDAPEQTPAVVRNYLERYREHQRQFTREAAACLRDELRKMIHEEFRAVLESLREEDKKK